jgi:hypothetical protein
MYRVVHPIHQEEAMEMCTSNTNNMAQKTWIKVSGTWKEVKNIWVKVSGVWVDQALSYINVLTNWNLCMKYPVIECSQGSIDIGHLGGISTDEFDLDVHPDDMTWYCTLSDTGDGTSWVGIYDDDDNDVVSPNTGTGDQTGMYAKALGRDNGPTPRSCQVTFHDDDGEADDLTLTITQAAAPV